MKLWTNEDVKDVELIVSKVSMWVDSYKNMPEVKIKPAQITEMVTLIGQAFEEIKHYKFETEKLTEANQKLADQYNNDIYSTEAKLTETESNVEKMQTAMRVALIHLNDGDYRAAESLLNEVLEG